MSKGSEHLYKIGILWAKYSQLIGKVSYYYYIMLFLKSKSNLRCTFSKYIYMQTVYRTLYFEHCSLSRNHCSWVFIKKGGFLQRAYFFSYMIEACYVSFYTCVSSQIKIKRLQISMRIGVHFSRSSTVFEVSSEVESSGGQVPNKSSTDVTRVQG